MVTKKVMREVEIECCDYCGEEIGDWNNWCGICNKMICDLCKSEIYESDDGAMCKYCEEAGFEMGVDEDGNFTTNKIYFKEKPYRKKTYW